MPARFTLSSLSHQWAIFLMLFGAGTTVHADDTTSTTALVVLIGGFDSDPSPAQLNGTIPRGRGNSGMYQLAGDLRETGLRAEYFNWNGTRAGELNRPGEPPTPRGIATYIREARERLQCRRLVVIGNSWGGHSACEVCEHLQSDPPVEIDLLLLLDPSSTGRETPVPTAVSANVRQVTSYCTRNMFVWGKWLEDERITHIDLGDVNQPFYRRGVGYEARFNFQAHVAAEWDEQIHADICQRVLGVSRSSPPESAGSGTGKSSETAVSSAGK